MFIRTKKTPRSNSTSVQLVESYRDQGKIKQRVVRHIGTTGNPEKLAELQALAEVIKTELLHQKLSERGVPKAIRCTHFF